MNRTQKAACFNLVGGILMLAFGICIMIGMFSAVFELPKIAKFWSAIILLYMIVSVILIRKKQSPAEPQADERDKQIQKTAVLVSFVAVWILLYIASVAACMIFEEDGYGTMPVALLPIINLGVFLAAMIIYSAAILIQYPRSIKDAE
jgi:hypothetical protein